jgi:hypothetical protein
MLISNVLKKVAKKFIKKLKVKNNINSSKNGTSYPDRYDLSPLRKGESCPYALVGLSACF